MDISNYAWAKNAIEVMASKGVINGTSVDTFTPTADITRGDFTLLIVKALGLNAKVEDNFSDVSPSAYYAEAVGMAKALGIVAGVGNNEFAPNTKISRQDMMVLVNRAMKVTGKELPAGSLKDLEKFGDTDKIASYAIQSIADLVASGIVQGDGRNINPQGYTTRAEAAVIIYNIYNK